MLSVTWVHPVSSVCIGSSFTFTNLKVELVNSGKQWIWYLQANDHGTEDETLQIMDGPWNRSIILRRPLASTNTHSCKLICDTLDLVATPEISAISSREDRPITTLWNFLPVRISLSHLRIITGANQVQRIDCAHGNIDHRPIVPHPGQKSPAICAKPAPDPRGGRKRPQGRGRILNVRPLLVLVCSCGFLFHAPPEADFWNLDAGPEDRA